MTTWLFFPKRKKNFPGVEKKKWKKLYTKNNTIGTNGPDHHSWPLDESSSVIWGIYNFLGVSSQMIHEKQSLSLLCIVKVWFIYVGCIFLCVWHTGGSREVWIDISYSNAKLHLKANNNFNSIRSAIQRVEKNCRHSWPQNVCSVV